MGNNLKKFRENSGESQYELAKASGCSRGYIAQIESGHQKLTLKQAEKLSRALHVSPYALLGSDAIKYEGSFGETLRSLVETNFDEIVEMRSAGKLPQRDFDLFMICKDATDGALTEADVASLKVMSDALIEAHQEVKQ
jgi:transcriptional regulator with XRE-family HTH domain